MYVSVCECWYVSVCMLVLGGKEHASARPREAAIFGSGPDKEGDRTCASRNVGTYYCLPDGKVEEDILFSFFLGGGNTTSSSMRQYALQHAHTGACCSAGLPPEMLCFSSCLFKAPLLNIQSALIGQLTHA